MENEVKTQDTRLSAVDRQFFAYIQLRRKRTVSAGELVSNLRITPEKEQKLLSRLARSGIIVRLNRGIYLVPERFPPGDVWYPDTYLVLNEFMKARNNGLYQVGGPNAFNYYGFEEQVPTRTYVYNNRISGRRTIGGSQFVFIRTYERRLGDTVELKSGTGEKIVMTSLARTLVDAVCDYSRYDTLPRAYGWIQNTLTENRLDAANLLQSTVSFGNESTKRRIGFILEERLGTPADTANKSMTSTKSLVALVPDRPPRGTMNRRWGIIDNE